MLANEMKWRESFASQLRVIYHAGQGEGCYRNVADYERTLSGI